MSLFVKSPQLNLTVGSTTFKNTRLLTAKINRYENAFDIGTLDLKDVGADIRSIIGDGGVVQVSVGDGYHPAAAANGVFSGVIRFLTESRDATAGQKSSVKCDGAGFGFAEMLLAQDYGIQASCAVQTLKTILSDATYGVVPKFVNSVLGSADPSGFAYDYSHVDDIYGLINYLYSPYKTCSKFMTDDLFPIVQAIKGLSAGPHWIVNLAGKLLVTTIGSHSVDVAAQGWPTYFGGGAAPVTLEEGVHFKEFNLQNMSTQSNYILYHSPWLWPSNRDYLTELVPIAGWNGNYMTVSYGNTTPQVGYNYIQAVVNNQNMYESFWYPDASNLALNIKNAGGYFNHPVFGCYLRRNASFSIANDPELFSITFNNAGASWAEADVDLRSLLPNPGVWAPIEFQVGSYANNTNAPKWFQGLGWTGSFDWSIVNQLVFKPVGGNQIVGAEIDIDGLYFAGWVIRVAKNSTKIAASWVKMAVINDPFGKDDSLNAADDTGSIARLCYAELLRRQTSPTIGTFLTCLAPSLQPGQIVHVHAKKSKAGVWQIDTNMRVPQLTQTIDGKASSTLWTVTSDVTNSKSQSAYTSVNMKDQNVRPEFQDRQSTGIKMRDVDITQLRLVHDYPS